MAIAIVFILYTHTHTHTQQSEYTIRIYKKKKRKKTGELTKLMADQKKGRLLLQTHPENKKNLTSILKRPMSAQCMCCIFLFAVYIVYTSLSLSMYIYCHCTQKSIYIIGRLYIHRAQVNDQYFQ